MPVVVAINRFVADTEAELTMVNDYAAKLGVNVALCEVWEKGGAGGEALAREVLALLDGRTAKYAPIYDVTLPVARQDRDDRQEASTAATASITRRPPRARSTTSRASACTTRRSAWRRRSTRSPTIPSRLGRPTGFRITVNEVYGSAGAGFVVAKTGDIMTMPGLPKVPAAEGMAVKAERRDRRAVLKLEDCYSARSATSGSTAIARRAGT